MAGGELAGPDAYLQGKPCPKCGYARTPADTNPAWQCPRCQIAYLKYRPGAAALRARLAAGSREMAREAGADRSIYALLAANLLALLIAYATRMTLRELMLVYWIQSVIIGVTSFLRILSLRRFDTENFRLGNRPLEETAGDKLRVAFFFLAHYGGFHFVYLGFLTLGGKGADAGPATGYLLCALVFAANHLYSLFQNVRRDAAGRPNLGVLMMLPYARIFPMHLTILFGGLFFGGTAAFVLFGALKIVADAVMHTVEHHVLAKGSLLPRADSAGDLPYSQR
ncbi:MAG: DUF6498-containing protein [Pseudomonadota bacterium]